MKKINLIIIILFSLSFVQLIIISIRSNEEEIIPQFQIKYDDSWYTNGILDPQKIPLKESFSIEDNLILVNKMYKLSVKYEPSIEEYNGCYLQKEALTAYKEMNKQALKDGINLTCDSTYRSYASQEVIFNEYLKRESYKEVLSYSAYPGTSEHQTGLAIDFIENNEECNYQQCFEMTETSKWLKENAFKYGFILRFPVEKTKITGYTYEPWHYRYVGKNHALKIKENNLTLEEYLLTIFQKTN